jgi:hypothetical protein
MNLLTKIIPSWPFIIGCLLVAIICISTICMLVSFAFAKFEENSNSKKENVLKKKMVNVQLFHLDSVIIKKKRIKKKNNSGMLFGFND